MKKALPILSLITLTVIFVISINVLANSDTQDTAIVEDYYQYGRLIKESDLPTEKVKVATIAGDPYIVDNFNNTAKGYILTNLADTKKEVATLLVTEEVLKREAKAQNIVIDNKEVDLFIKEQKSIYASEAGKECSDDFNSFINGLGLTEDQYWDKYYEEYRDQLTIGKLKDQLYDQFLYSKVIERLDDLGMVLSDEEIQKVYENEKGIYNDEIYKEFQDYYESYQKDLLVKYDVKYTTSIN